MNENLDLTKILKGCPRGISLYSTIYGEVILVRIDYVEGEKNSFTLFISNDLKVKRLFNASSKNDLKDLNKLTYEVKYYEDLVINGLGFVKIVNKGIINVYIDKDVDTFMRKSLI